MGEQPASTAFDEEFDFVIVGAGSAGCVVATRLSENPNNRVALLEAGSDTTSFWIRAPLGYGRLYDHPKFNWLMESEPEPELLGHRTFQPRGKIVGGTGAINGMIYMRGQRQDYDYWRQLGNVGWSYDDVLPYFKKSEDNAGGASAYHGVGGPIGVTTIPHHELADAFIAAGVQAGYTRNDDFNGARQEGFGYNQITTRHGRRSSTAVDMLKPARSRRNLAIKPDALVTKVIIENRQAIGVEYVAGGIRRRVRARREVIVAGGVFNTPQILQLSGVGPGALLTGLGIKVQADVPGVGENLQDHFTASMSYKCTRPVTVNDAVNNPIRRYAMGARYLLFRSGMMASNASYAGGCIRTDPALEAPDVKLHLQLWGRSSAGLRARGSMGLYPFSSFGVSMNLMHPDSRGVVKIRSADPQEQPTILFNFFTHESDRRASIAAMRAIRKVMSMPAVSSYVAEEFNPGPQCQSDEDFMTFLREKGRSNHHATSSCKMGVDDMAAVDPRLRVRDIAGLRVADASIMPRIVAGNTNAAAIMIGEKASAMIQEDARKAVAA